MAWTLVTPQFFSRTQVRALCRPVKKVQLSHPSFSWFLPPLQDPTTEASPQHNTSTTVFHPFYLACTPLPSFSMNKQQRSPVSTLFSRLSTYFSLAWRCLFYTNGVFLGLQHLSPFLCKVLMIIFFQTAISDSTKSFSCSGVFRHVSH